MTALLSVWSLCLCAFAVIYLGSQASWLKQSNLELELTNFTEPTLLQMPLAIVQPSCHYIASSNLSFEIACTHVRQS